MNYQKKLRCVHCHTEGQIKKVKVHNILSPRDEHIRYMCDNCKQSSSTYEFLIENAKDIPYLLDEHWEWGDEKDLQEKIKEEDIIDLTKEGKELKAEEKKLRKFFKKGKLNET